MDYYYIKEQVNYCAPKFSNILSLDLKLLLKYLTFG